MDSHIFKRWFEEEFVPKVKKHLVDKGLQPKAVIFLDNKSKPLASTSSLGFVYRIQTPVLVYNYYIYIMRENPFLSS